MAIVASAFGKRAVLSLRSEIRAQKMNLALRWFVRRITAASKVVLAQNPTAEARLREIAPDCNGKLVVMPNWIDASAYNVERSPEPGQAPVRFLFMSRVERPKGIFELLEATRSLAGKWKFEVTICGIGSSLNEANAYCSRNDIGSMVTFEGWVGGPRKLSVLQRADVFVLPSYTEGTPNALLEAMASGLPVIGTDVGGIPMLVTHGVEGFLVSPQDATGLRCAMELFLNDRNASQRMGAAARARVLSHHDISVVCPLMAKALGVRLESC
jgi:glycosyltransferase involved in cell wall biosynthesis